jgi:hypothetical protein
MFSFCVMDRLIVWVRVNAMDRIRDILNIRPRSSERVRIRFSG